jgi:hypothetical protein
VLAARASGATTRRSFGALIDLLDGVRADELADLPAPQRQALEVASRSSSGELSSTTS